jgi:RHS repeat-associated protein
VAVAGCNATTAGTGTTNYTYDGDGERVSNTVGSTTTLYWYGAGGGILSETDGSGSLLKDYVYFAGRRIAYVYNSSAYFYFGDQIGTSRVITYSNGQICYDADFYPFGGERTPYVNSCSQNYKFAGMERDAETANYHTLFRNYEWEIARWMSPDPLGGDATNPQSLNRYAYVMNNPTTLTDPLGLQPGDHDPCENNPNKVICGNDARGSSFFGGSCYVDGLSTSCGIAYSLLSMGNGPLSALGLITAAVAQQEAQSQSYGVLVQYPDAGMSGYYLPDMGDPWFYFNSQLTEPQFTVTSVGSSGGARAPDFYQLTLNVGELVGYTFSLTVDRHGHVYVAPLGANVGKSATPGSGSLTAGWVRNWNGPVPQTDLTKFLTSWGCSAVAGYWGGYMFGWSGGGQAHEVGLVSPQGGISCGYTWKVH